MVAWALVPSELGVLLGEQGRVAKAREAVGTDALVRDRKDLVGRAHAGAGDEPHRAFDELALLRGVDGALQYRAIRRGLHQTTPP